MGKFIDYTGTKFGELTIIEDAGKRLSGGEVVWIARCNCGKVLEVRMSRVKRKPNPSCSECAKLNLTNQRFGKLLVNREMTSAEGKKKGIREWECVCDCGNIRCVRTNSLTANKVTSCESCIIMPYVDLKGLRFGRFLVLGKTGTMSNGNLNWNCLCDCGNEKVVASYKLSSGTTQSCGCLRSEISKQLMDVIVKNSVGANHWKWNPDLNEDDRRRNETRTTMPETRRWRADVLARDKNRCRVCKISYTKGLHSHHLDGYNWALTKRYDVNNGVTLCKKCHLEFHSKYGYGYNTENQFIEFESSKNNL